jgi:hypothetical protein
MNSTQHIASALHGCPSLSIVLGLHGLACLAMSSKTLQQASHSVIRMNAREWLQPATKSADAAQVQSVLTAAPAAVEAGTEHLPCMPGVPLNIAKILVTAGLRISHAQLTAAANSMAAGVEVWVEAQQQLGVDSDIPSIAAAICCRRASDMVYSWVSCLQAPLVSHAKPASDICTAQAACSGPIACNGASCKYH